MKRLEVFTGTFNEITDQYNKWLTEHGLYRVYSTSLVQRLWQPAVNDYNDWVLLVTYGSND